MPAGHLHGHPIPTDRNVTDAFALLDEPRRPALDPEALKSRFLALSAQVHPDRLHGAPEAERAEANARYAELNAAYQRLKEPRDRLLHLYELESGGPPRDIQRIPPGTMDLFVEVGEKCRDCDAFLAGRTETASPMLKLKAFQAGMAWTESMMELQQRVNGRRDALAAELAAMNDVWAAAPAVGEPGRAAALPLERLEQVYRTLSYVARWTEQLQERLVRLAV